jgi:hypothetical protein
MTGREVVDALCANYFFTGSDFSVRAWSDASGFACLVVLVARSGERKRLIGLRLLDYPASPPTLRFWRPARWDEDGFPFDFATKGDAGSGKQDQNGIATMCIPYHVDFYAASWHADPPWVPAEADILVADLVENILRRS